jgi:hypothetical protein
MATKRLPDNQEDRVLHLQKHDAARFIDVVERARKGHADYVLMTVKAFAGEPDPLYVALNYAYHEGMAVTMVSDDARYDDELARQRRAA